MTKSVKQGVNKRISPPIGTSGFRGRRQLATFAMTYTPKPEHMRPPHLNEQELHQALDELTAKIKILKNRAHTTTAHSEAHYHEHIAALEVKRAKLAQQLGPAASGAATDEHKTSTWEEIRRGIDNLRKDIQNLF
ncbi:MAG TPA: hypothetical protein VF598_08995 [Hymenobacter sp.]